MKKKIGVLLSGCGFKDGSEIYESVISLLAIDRAGAEAVCMAPNVELDVIDHLHNQTTGEKRNVLVESARIARGQIRDIAQVQASELDALVIPGGYGAAKNLCDFASKGAAATPHPEVARLVKDVHQQGKPIGAICIAPAAIAAILGKSAHPALTIGNDAGTSKLLSEMGAQPQNCEVQDFYVDTQNKIVSTPAYMLAHRISEAAAGIEKLIQKIIELS